MQSKTAARRVHSAELKAAVLAACEERGASISAVALAHGLNANLVRKWRVGRGLKRSGVWVPAAPAPLASDMQFVPVQLASRAVHAAHPNAPARRIEPAACDAAALLIHIELQRGPARLSVHWPAGAAGHCVAWLRELATAVLK